jgi:NAD-dependent SIR2 family protein deacetylase
MPEDKKVEENKTFCDGPIKPNITFFGEALPEEFFFSLKDITGDKCDLMIVIGTGLAVSPFNSIVGKPDQDVPRVLINLENTVDNGFDFENLIDYPERLFLQGKCDEVIEKLITDIGSKKEFDKNYSFKK